MLRPLLLTFMIGVVSACSHAIQTSSGANYVARSALPLDADIARAASV